jgi:hypothetical protein
VKAPSRLFDVTTALHWIGIALLGIYIATVLAAALPLRLQDPAWILRVCGSLRGGVSFPLIAMGFFLLQASLLEPQRQGTYLPGPSRLAYLAALGFFLMIPLQTWASFSQLNRFAGQERDQLRRFTRGLDLIRIAITEDQLSDAIASIPGAPRFTPGTLTVPLPQARQMLIRQIEPQLKLRMNQLRDENSQRWQEAWLLIVKDAIVALFAALGFAAMGRRRPDRRTLLESLLGPSMGPLPQQEEGESANHEEIDEHTLYP